ncbi:hypothetical protein SEA_JALFARM20_43 [Mycobacterium phage JalFarm20]|nr:hypothetical protein SEA_JALFARM20_43 [Mycobacterium phage JalFarm20]
MGDKPKLERIFCVRPAYDCIRVQPCVHGSESCQPGSGGSHGVHNAEMHLTVRGGDAEVTIVINTGWDLPTVPLNRRASVDREYPRGAFVSIHTGRPRYEGAYDYEEPRSGESCQDWGGCYQDVGYSMSDEPTRLLVEKGSDAVWEWLENLHSEVMADMPEKANNDGEHNQWVT